MSDAQGMATRWWAFVRERHPLSLHLGMAAAFALGNAGAASAVGEEPASWPRLLFSVLLVAAFFLRLRVFDEIKDHETDVATHPDRPLPRGLVSVGEARRVVWGIACVELVLSVAMGWPAVTGWSVAFLYSLAMYREFGVGPWLRPRMELYAVTHTLVATLLGITIVASALGEPFWSLPAVVWMFAPLNWALFNVFEFSRKTFAPLEERPEADSYSRRWGPRGAVALTLFWAGVAVACLAATLAGTARGFGGVGIFLVGLGTAGSLAIPYAARPAPWLALQFRISMSTWATLLYVVVGLTGLRGS